MFDKRVIKGSLRELFGWAVPKQLISVRESGSARFYEALERTKFFRNKPTRGARVQVVFDQELKSLFRNFASDLSTGKLNKKPSSWSLKIFITPAVLAHENDIPFEGDTVTRFIRRDRVQSFPVGGLTLQEVNSLRRLWDSGASMERFINNATKRRGVREIMNARIFNALDNMRWNNDVITKENSIFSKAPDAQIS